MRRSRRISRQNQIRQTLGHIRRLHQQNKPSTNQIRYRIIPLTIPIQQRRRNKIIRRLPKPTRLPQLPRRRIIRNTNKTTSKSSNHLSLLVVFFIIKCMNIRLLQYNRSRTGLRFSWARPQPQGPPLRSGPCVFGHVLFPQKSPPSSSA